MLAVAGCGGENSPASLSGENSAGNIFTCVTGFLSAVINGVAWAACAPVLAQYDRRVGALAVSGGDLSPTLMQNIGLAFAVGVHEPVVDENDEPEIGTFPRSVSIGIDSPANASLTFAAAPGVVHLWEATGVTGGSGTITLTSFTANSATGTFSFILLPSAPSGATGVKTVTQGVFSVTF